MHAALVQLCKGEVGYAVGTALPEPLGIDIEPELEKVWACAGSRSAPMARTIGLSLSSAERSAIAERPWDDMGATSRCKAIGNFQRTPLAIDGTTVERSSFERWKNWAYRLRYKREHRERGSALSLEHAKSIDSRKALYPG